MGALSDLMSLGGGRKKRDGGAASKVGAISAGGGAGEPDPMDSDPTQVGKKRSGPSRDDSDGGLLGAGMRVAKRIGKRRD